MHCPDRKFAPEPAGPLESRVERQWYALQNVQHGWENASMELGLRKVPLCSTHINLSRKPTMHNTEAMTDLGLKIAKIIWQKFTARIGSNRSNCQTITI